MNILVTGINGFLGSFLALSLRQKHQLIGISRVSEVANNISIYNSGNLSEIQINPDIIIICHAAISSGNTQPDTATLFNDNVLFTEKITTQFPKAKYIYISSASIYNTNDYSVSELSFSKPANNYAMSKYWGELIIQRSLACAIIRLSSLYGIGMKENTLIPNYVNQAICKGIIEVWGAGIRKQNYFHVDDAVELVNAVILNDQWSKEMYLGTDISEYSNLQIAEIIAAETNAKIVFKNTDLSASINFDNKVTRDSLNWKPATTISKGLKQYIEWKKRQF